MAQKLEQFKRAVDRGGGHRKPERDTSAQGNGRYLSRKVVSVTRYSERTIESQIRQDVSLRRNQMPENRTRECRAIGHSALQMASERLRHEPQRDGSGSFGKSLSAMST